MENKVKAKPFFSTWKYVLIVSILLIGFGFGCAYDYQISDALFNKNDYWMVGMIISNILFVAIDFFLCVTCLVLLFSSLNFKSDNKKKYIVGIILGVLVSIGINVFFGIELKDFNRLITQNNLWIIICVLVPTLTLAGSFVFTWFILKNKVKENKYWLGSLMVILMFCFGSLIYAILFPIWSRPRPLWEFNCTDPTTRFKNWWELQPFARFTYADKTARQYLASFPSGHASSTCLMIGIVICLDKLNVIKNKKISELLFWLANLLVIIMGFLRVIGGNHHFSDVCLSGVIAVTYPFVSRFIKVGTKKVARSN